VTHCQNMIVLIACCSAAIASSSVRAAEDLDIMYHERAPYYVTTTHGVGGVIGERARRIFSKAQISTSYRRVPASRQLKEIEWNQHKTCALGWFKKPEREAFAKFTGSIYQDKPLVLLVRRSESKTDGITSLAQLRNRPGLRMGTKLGYSYGPVLDNLVNKLGANVITTTQDNAGLARMLLGKRFDFFIAAAEEAQGILDQTDGANDNARIVPLSDSPPGNRRYIICSKRVDDVLIERLNTAINALSKSP